MIDRLALKRVRVDDDRIIMVLGVKRFSCVASLSLSVSQVDLWRGLLGGVSLRPAEFVGVSSASWHLCV